MSNPNGDRIAALARQTGSAESEVTATVAGQFLRLAPKRGEQGAAIVTLNYVKEWLSIIAETDEPSQKEQEQGLVLQNFLAADQSPAADYPEYRVPIMRLLVAVAKGETINPNPTPAFGSL